MISQQKLFLTPDHLHLLYLSFPLFIRLSLISGVTRPHSMYHLTTMPNPIQYTPQPPPAPILFHLNFSAFTPPLDLSSYNSTPFLLNIESIIQVLMYTLSVYISSPFHHFQIPLDVDAMLHQDLLISVITRS